MREKLIRIASARGTLLGLSAVLISSTVTGCSPSAESSPPCMPPNFSISVSEARAGNSVSLSAPAATCNPSYGEEARVEISVSTDSGKKVLHTKAPMEDNGAFEYSYHIPKTTKPGVLAISAMPADVDWCDDTGTNNRLKNASEFERTSCEIPVRQLAIIEK